MSGLRWGQRAVIPARVQVYVPVVAPSGDMSIIMAMPPGSTLAAVGALAAAARYARTAPGYLIIAAAPCWPCR